MWNGMRDLEEEKIIWWWERGEGEGEGEGDMWCIVACGRGGLGLIWFKKGTNDTIPPHILLLLALVSSQWWLVPWWWTPTNKNTSHLGSSPNPESFSFALNLYFPLMETLLPSRFKRVCVFCGSSPGKNPSYQLAAIQLANQLVLLLLF